MSQAYEAKHAKNDKQLGNFTVKAKKLKAQRKGKPLIKVWHQNRRKTWSKNEHVNRLIKATKY